MDGDKSKASTWRSVLIQGAGIMHGIARENTIIRQEHNIFILRHLKNLPLLFAIIPVQDRILTLGISMSSVA